MPDPLPPLVSASELAEALGIDRSTVSRLVRSGRPVAGLSPLWLTDHRYAFRRPDVERLLGVGDRSSGLAA